MLCLNVPKNIVNNNTAIIAVYCGNEPDSKPQPIYLIDKYHPDLLILKRNNLTSYINPETFKNGKLRYPVGQSVINGIYQAISSGIILNASKCEPIMYNYYTMIMNEIVEMLPSRYIAEKNHRFFACPTKRRNQRDFVIASGPSGVGKSWFAADYCTTYNWMYPDRKIYLLSAKEYDEAFDTLKCVERVPQKDWKKFMGDFKINEAAEMVIDKKAPTKRVHYTDDDDDGDEAIETTDADLEKEIAAAEALEKEEKVSEIPKKVDFKNSLFVFDDIEHITPDEAKKLLQKFKAYIMQVGRSSQIDIVLCNHMQMNYKETRDELNECTAVVMFPKSATIYHMQRYLKTHLGLDAVQVNRIINSHYRWVMLYKQHPLTAVTDSEIFIIN